jgi:hypothetical protein
VRRDRHRKQRVTFWRPDPGATAAPRLFGYNEGPAGRASSPNDWRLSRLVYHQTRDFLRRVSRDVSIGAAFKRERPLDHYFVLCRRALA